MKRKIVFASHDPGGFNLLIPIIQSLSEEANCELHFLLAGVALNKFKEFKLGKTNLHFVSVFPCLDFPQEYDVNEWDIYSILRKIAPNLILTGTSINSNIERYCISFGNEAGIKTLSFVDSWIGEDLRFTSHKVVAFPTKILVCDKAMERLYQKFVSDKCSLTVVGNSHLEKLSLHRKLRVDLESIINQERILFFSENLFHYYPNGKLNEMQIIQQILLAYSGIKKISICIRPHPLESNKHWINFVEKNKSFNSLISLELDDVENVHESILRSAMAFGISSMALIESSLLGLFTFSYQVGISEEKDMLYIPFEEYGIEQIADLTRVCSVFENAGNNKRNEPHSLPFTDSLKRIKKLISSSIFDE